MSLGVYSAYLLITLCGQMLAVAPCFVGSSMGLMWTTKHEQESVPWVSLQFAAFIFCNTVISGVLDRELVLQAGVRITRTECRDSTREKETFWWRAITFWDLIQPLGGISIGSCVCGYKRKFHARDGNCGVPDKKRSKRKPARNCRRDLWSSPGLQHSEEGVVEVWEVGSVCPGRLVGRDASRND